MAFRPSRHPITFLLYMVEDWATAVNRRICQIGTKNANFSGDFYEVGRFGKSSYNRPRRRAYWISSWRLDRPNFCIKLVR